jgi:Flp pilus assembly protein TadD
MEAEHLLRRAIGSHPDDTRLISHLANLLWYSRKDFQQAEQYFERAYSLQPDDEVVVGRFANFIWKIKRDFARAERLYAKAVNLRPDDGDNLCNYAGFFLAQRRESEQILLRAWALSSNRRDQTTAELAFYRGLQLRLNHKVDSVPLSYLKTLLHLDFPRMPWSFDEVLRLAGEKFTAQIFDLYRSLAAAILDPHRLPDLERS